MAKQKKKTPEKKPKKNSTHPKTQVKTQKPAAKKASLKNKKVSTPKPVIKKFQNKPNTAAKTREIEKELKNIYKDDKGKLPKMTSLEFKKNNRLAKTILFLIIILAVLFTVSFLGFLVFQPTPSFTGDKANLEIKAPFTTISGEEITYEFKYTNNEDISLTKNQLIVYLPLGFILDESSKDPIIDDDLLTEGYSNIRTWKIDDLSPKQTGTLELTGRLIGQPDTEQTISAILSYTPANFSSEFQKNINFDTQITDSLIKIETNTPNQLSNEEETEFNVKINNTSDKINLKDLEIELISPAKFELLSSTVGDQNNDETITINEDNADEQDSNSKSIKINELLAQEQRQISFKGKFSVEESQTAEFEIIVKLKGPGDEYFEQIKQPFATEIIKGDLLNNLIIQNSNKNKAINFDDELNYEINIGNKSKNTLGDLKIRAVLDSPLLDWPSLNDSQNGILENNQILWTKDQIPELSQLLPEEDLIISFTIKVNKYSKKYKEEDLQITSFFESQINLIDNKESEVVLESNTIINEINTNLELDAYARYYDDNKLAVGSGPLPPKVGEKTKYRIYWQLNNTLHEIKNIEVKASLPSYITFEQENDSSAGNVYINDQNEIVWQISRIPNTVDQSTAEFEISITPRDEDAQKILTLLPEVKLEALDSKTNSTVYKTVTGITTNLENDPIAEGKGLVQE